MIQERPAGHYSVWIEERSEHGRGIPFGERTVYYVHYALWMGQEPARRTLIGPIYSRANALRAREESVRMLAALLDELIRATMEALR